jgi:hypothetical protein
MELHVLPFVILLLCLRPLQNGLHGFVAVSLEKSLGSELNIENVSKPKGMLPTGLNYSLLSCTIRMGEGPVIQSVLHRSHGIVGSWGAKIWSRRQLLNRLDPRYQAWLGTPRTNVRIGPLKILYKLFTKMAG